MDEELGAAGGAGGMDEELRKGKRREEVLMAWMEGWRVEEGAGGVDEELGCRRKCF